MAHITINPTKSVLATNYTKDLNLKITRLKAEKLRLQKDKTFLIKEKDTQIITK
ncbi:8439_t:CDS:2 [Racocetra fulgida]|uniref:8439_t:CDS:1 n=1 Tax=Racocetra fulgida TaxID=60492 RepID=A0A9N8VK52_9GLOM|nr:8439_t:CDS:2 [Racocetra fulgida]